MSFRRVFIWTCDHCQKTAEREAHGLPDGWTWGKMPGMRIEQWCQYCSVGWKLGADRERLSKTSP